MVVILVPLPRYVRNSCCDDSEHVTNQGEKYFYEEFLGAEKRLLDAAAAGGRTGEARVVDLCKLFGSAETSFQELTTPDGTSVWAGDGVHLTSPAYRVAARLLIAELERSDKGEAGEPATKEAATGECRTGPRSAADPAGHQAAAADAETSSNADVAVRHAPAHTKKQ
jgi:hypothetical protein